MAESDALPASEGSRLKILVVRPDRVGDVVLSTPVLAALRKHYPGAEITFLVRENVAPLLRGLDCVDQLFIYDPQGRHRGWRGFLLLMRAFRRNQYRIAINLQSDFRIAAAQFGAGVRYRVGPLSKIHSFMFYNRGYRQRRSQVEMHEADYNLQLLRRLGIRTTRTEFETAVVKNPERQAEAAAWLRERGWDGVAPVVVVHPGMGGSALNWPEEHFADLTAQLVREGSFVLMTAGPLESGILERVKKAALIELADSGTAAERLIEYGGREAKEIDFLAALYAVASVVVAPSTGPLHVAVAVGTPVVTFYPPIRVQSALRWGPYARDEKRSSVLVPDVYCGEDFKCRGTLCNYYPCMRGLTVDLTLEQVRAQLKRGKRDS